MSRKCGSRDILGSNKPVQFEPKPESMSAVLHGEPPHRLILIVWPAMDASDMFDGETLKGYIPYASTKDSFDVARNDFVFEREDEERKKSVLYYLIIFNDNLTVSVLDKD